MVSDAARRKDPFAAPLYASPADLARVCPAFIVTAECDVLRDDGELYAKRLMEVGVNVTAQRFMGTLHNFPIIDALKDSGPAIAATFSIGNALRAALHHVGSDEE